MSVASYHLLNVFTDEAGGHGNPLGVFLDGAAVPADGRQAVAAKLGYSETVFVDDPARGVLRIFTPASELPLAGHPLVGSGWLLARETGACDVLRPPAGDVSTWQEGDLRWIRARPEWAPKIVFIQMDSPEEVDSLDGGPDPYGISVCWAWIDEEAGVVRSRAFPRSEGIEEDEATGAAALRMGGSAGRPIEIHQGKGSVLRARPGPDGTVDVGGRVKYVGVRHLG